MKNRSDRKGWKRTTFGEMCRNLNVSERNPIANGIDRYIGLEHIEANNLHISSWGNVADGTTFTKRFKKGQILFGKRRSYLRKAAIADFEGICSGDILVLDANEKVIIPDLLPFIVNSDRFFDHAIQTSAGSLSPRTKFQDLAKLTFLLPPKDQQTRLAELLWSGDVVVRKYEGLLKECIRFYKTTNENLITGKLEAYRGNSNGSKWHKVSIYNLRDPNDRYSFTGGPFGSDLKSEHYTSNGIRILQLQNIGEGEFLDDYKLFTSPEKADELKSCNIFPGEILLAKMAPVARCCIIPNSSDRYVMCSDGIRLSVDKSKYDNDFIYHSLNSQYFRRSAETKQVGSTRPRIGLNDLKVLEILIPPTIEEQKYISRKLNDARKTMLEVISHFERFKQIQKQLVNQIFS